MDETLEYFMLAKSVQRFHTMPLNKPQDIAAHSFGVACLGMLINPLASANFYKAALLHDMGEAMVGDIPAPTKNEMQGLRETCEQLELGWVCKYLIAPPELDEAEDTLLKFCDALDGALTCLYDLRSGNKNAMRAAANYGKYVMRISGTIPATVPWKEEAGQCASFVHHKIFGFLPEDFA